MLLVLHAEPNIFPSFETIEFELNWLLPGRKTRNMVGWGDFN